MQAMCLEFIAGSISGKKKKNEKAVHSLQHFIEPFNLLIDRLSGKDKNPLHNMLWSAPGSLESSRKNRKPKAELINRTTYCQDNSHLWPQVSAFMRPFVKTNRYLFSFNERVRL